MVLGVFPGFLLLLAAFAASACLLRLLHYPGASFRIYIRGRLLFFRKIWNTGMASACFAVSLWPALPVEIKNARIPWLIFMK